MKFGLIGLSFLLALATGSQTLIPGGVFSGETGLLYTLESVTEQQRYYIEAVEGCHIECSQTCLQQFYADKLASCITTCGCGCLVTSEYNPMVEALAAYKLNVHLPNGKAQSYDVGQEKGEGDLRVSGNPEQNFRVTFNDRQTRGRDFALFEKNQKKGKHDVTYVEWQTQDKASNGFYTSDIESFRDGFKQTSSVNLPNQNYKLRFDKSGRLQDGLYGPYFDYSEKVSDGKDYLKFGASGQSNLYPEGNGDFQVGTNYEYGPETNVLQAYNVIVTYPDGSQGLVKLDDEPGLGEFTVKETNRGNTKHTSVVYDDYRTPKKDLIVNETDRRDLRNNQDHQKVTWQTADGLYDGAYERQTKKLANGFDQKEAWVLPNQGEYKYSEKKLRTQSYRNGGSYEFTDNAVSQDEIANVSSTGSYEDHQNSGRGAANLRVNFRPNNAVLNANEINVTFPDGSSQKVELPGGESDKLNIVIKDNNDGTASITFDDPNSPETDLAVDGENFIGRERVQQRVTFTTPNPRDKTVVSNDLSAQRNKQDGTVFTQDLKFSQPNRDQYLDIHKKIEVQEERNSASVNISETITDGNQTANLDGGFMVVDNGRGVSGNYGGRFSYNNNYGNYIDTANLEEAVKEAATQEEPASGWLWYLTKGLIFISALAGLAFGFSFYLANRKHNSEYTERLVYYHQI